ncbi:hypothetical protein [Streptomyces radicis]|uniref:Uncharacterized protein n=1 Tax=Streptomyces radicis TaxID=1750517 RepID=A0A3A9WG08_9ACTN|nr:hypothetical protein [Streptomyces radicis]RKN11968.1 hypothetical protein D7319_03415 [Streptomyces radicis]RKN25980.1 hypothetical protein D7318_07065 [Streptomyces radicis]
MEPTEAAPDKGPDKGPGEEPGERPGEASEEALFGGGPPAQLYLPQDWFDILADGPDAEAAKARYGDVVARAFPDMPAEGHAEITAGLLRWRGHLWNNGFLTHGVIAVPEADDRKAALWQILVTTLRMPAMNPDIDPTALLRRMIPQSELGFVSHVEQYETDMGLGIGVMGRIPLLPPGSLPEGVTEAPQGGMAAAISCAPGAEYGLLVLGTCLDPEQDVMLAMLIALIAGKSRLAGTEGKAADEKAAVPAP